MHGSYLSSLEWLNAFNNSYYFQQSVTGYHIEDCNFEIEQGHEMITLEGKTMIFDALLLAILAVDLPVDPFPVGGIILSIIISTNFN